MKYNALLVYTEQCLSSIEICVKMLPVLIHLHGHYYITFKIRYKTESHIIDYLTYTPEYILIGSILTTLERRIEVLSHGTLTSGNLRA